MKTCSVSTSLNNIQSNEIERLSYDLWELRISVRLVDNRLAYVVFNDSIGHRVLDEGDLTEYWEPSTRSDGWLWEIKKGGWLGECIKQKKFLLFQDSAREFMILGNNECVNVIAQSAPLVYSPSESA